jgi:hypothetical protein
MIDLNTLEPAWRAMGIEFTFVARQLIEPVDGQLYRSMAWADRGASAIEVLRLHLAVDFCETLVQCAERDCALRAYACAGPVNWKGDETFVQDGVGRSAGGAGCSADDGGLRHAWHTAAALAQLARPGNGSGRAAHRQPGCTDLDYAQEEYG